MSLYKRGGVYWFNFKFNGQRVQKSTGTGNLRAAGDIERAFRVQLARGEVGLEEPRVSPMLKNFTQRFLGHMKVHCGDKVRTYEFWSDATKRLLKFPTLANARLDQIKPATLARFTHWATERWEIGTVNRSLATLRRALRLAQDWGEVNRIPRIKLLPGEANREYILPRDVEPAYLEECGETMHNLATFLLETGLRLTEALTLTWDRVHLNPAGSATRGYVYINKGKSKYAKRNVSLTERAKEILRKQQVISESEFVFVREDKKTMMSRSTVCKWHQEIRREMGLPEAFVIHSFRHTMLTRLGEAGADGFTIQRIAGHSSITISQRYVHPTPETMERAIDSLERLNVREGATILTTGENRASAEARN